MGYEATLFSTIARQTITGEPEQYLYASASGLTAMFSPPQISDAINHALSYLKDPISVVRAEYMLLPSAFNIVFDDGVTGFIEVDGVLVELSVRRLSDSSWRVLFSRVDAAKLYTNLTDRVATLERQMSEVKAAKQRCEGGKIG